MSINSNGFFFDYGFEGAQGQQGQADAASQAGLDSVQAGADMESESQALQIEQVKLEQAQAELENLEGQQQVMQKQVDAGQGMDQAGAQATQLAVEAALIRIGAYNPRETIILGAESFGGGQSSYSALKLSNEGLVDKLKELWKKLKEGFKAFIQKVVDFFGKFFDNADKVLKYAEALRTKITERSGWEEENKEIDYGNAVKCVSVDGKFEQSKMGLIFNNHSILTKNFNNVIKHAESVVAGLSEVIKNKEDSIPEKLYENILKYAESYISNAAAENKEMDGNTTVLTHGPYIFGETLVIRYNKDELTLSVGTEQKTKPVKETKQPAINTSMMEAICNDVVSLMKETNTFKKEQSKVKAVVDSFVKLCDSAIGFASNVSKLGSDAARVEATISKVRRGTSSIGNSLSRTVIMLPSWNVKLGNAGLSVVNSALNNLKEKKK